MNTYDSPGCYHDAIRYCSDTTGLSQMIELQLNSLSETRLLRKNGTSKLIYPIYSIFVELMEKRWWCSEKQTIKGNINVLKVRDSPIDYNPIISIFPIDTTFTKIGVLIRRPLEDFNLKIESAGNYQDSLKGGWYQSVKKIKIDNQYFAMMDCSCSK